MTSIGFSISAPMGYRKYHLLFFMTDWRLETLLTNLITNIWAVHITTSQGRYNRAGKDPGKATKMIKGNAYLSFKDRLKH